MNIGITKPIWSCEISKDSIMIFGLSSENVLTRFTVIHNITLNLIRNSFPAQFLSYDQLIR